MKHIENNLDLAYNFKAISGNQNLTINFITTRSFRYVIILSN